MITEMYKAISEEFSRNATKLTELFEQGAATMTIVIVVSLLSNLIFDKVKKPDDSLEEKIIKLTTSLNDSAKSISDIEKEINKRRVLVDKMKEDADESERLKNINSEQVAAVAQALRGELQNESRSNFWYNIIINFFFAFIGAAIGELFRLFRKLKIERSNNL